MGLRPTCQQPGGYVSCSRPCCGCAERMKSSKCPQVVSQLVRQALTHRLESVFFDPLTRRNPFERPVPALQEARCLGSGLRRAGPCNDWATPVAAKPCPFRNSAASSRCATPAGRPRCSGTTMALTWLCLQDLHLHRSRQTRIGMNPPRGPEKKIAPPFFRQPRSAGSLPSEVARSRGGLHHGDHEARCGLAVRVNQPFRLTPIDRGSGKDHGCLFRWGHGAALDQLASGRTATAFSSANRVRETSPSPATGPTLGFCRSSRGARHGGRLLIGN